MEMTMETTTPGYPEGYLEASLYDERTGRITVNLIGTVDVLGAQGFPYVLGRYESDTHYIVNTQPHGRPTPKERPAQTTEQDATVTTPGVPVVLSSLPRPGCEVRIAGQRYTVEDGVLEWSTSQPGVYAITVKAFPYLDWNGKVEVLEVTP